MTPSLAIFDLDETIINCKSLFETYKQYCVENYEQGNIFFEKKMRDIAFMQEDNIPREEINKRYYENFSGINQAQMIVSIKQWLANGVKTKKFFNKSIMDRLDFHKKNQDIIMIISGSFMDCLSIIADYLQIDHFIGITLEVLQGVYTGKIVGTQTIGEGKLTSLLEYVQKNNFCLKKSYGYGDHISDKLFLEAVDNPYVLATNEDIVSYAQRNSWHILY